MIADDEMRTNQWPGYSIITELSIYPSMNVVTATNQARGKSSTCLTKEVSIPPYSWLVRPQLEYAIQAHCSYLKKDIYHLERIQRAAAKWVKGLRDHYNEGRHKQLKLQSLEKRKEKTRFDRDSQGHIKPNWPRSNPTVHVLQKNRT